MTTKPKLRWRATMLCVAVLSVGACERGDRTPTPRQRERVLAKSPLPPAPPPALVSPYERDGRTLARADDPVLGVAVPSIARVTSRREKIARVVVDRVPYEAVERFYQKYLQTGELERLPLGVRFGGATPLPPGDGRARVDVVLRQAVGRTEISIYDESPSHTPPPRGEAAVREAAGIAPVDYSRRVKGVTE